jgi:hypothetical protein
MPEIGLLPFARVALQVASAVLPARRSRFSKRQFTQPQLLAILCLMRYGTGLSPHGVSAYFIRRVEQHAGGKTRYRHYLKWMVTADVDRQIILSQRARQGPRCDAPALPGLLDAARRVRPSGLVLADAEFDSEANHQHSRDPGGSQRHSHQCPAGLPERKNPPADAPPFSWQVVRSARESGNHFFGDQTKILHWGTWPQRAFASAASPVAGLGLQSLPLAAPNLRGCQRSHFKSIRIRTSVFFKVNSFSIRRSKKTGGGVARGIMVN